MATPSPHVVLIPGAGSDPGYWDALRAELTTRGCSSTAVDLPCTDEQALLEDYATAVVAAVQRDPAAQGRPLQLLAHSFGAFTAALVPDLLPVQHLTLISPMIPAPGESGSAWWSATGQEAAHQDAARTAGLSLPLEMDELFYNGFTSDQRRAATAWDREQAEAAFAQPWPATALPSIPTTVLTFAEDRLFPPAFVARLAAERVPDMVGPVRQVPGGHMGMVSHPTELAAAVIG